MDQSVDIPLAATPVPGEPRWANYARGVVAGFGARGLVPPALDALMISDVPLGGGLSSSAAFEVAIATLLEAALGKTLEPTEKARLCRAAEHDYAQVPCGIMDQLISVLGDEAGALLIDCRTEQTRLVPFADPAVSLLIANSNVRHSLGDGAYAARRAACVEAAQKLGVPELGQATPAMVAAAEAALGPLLHRRARHVVTENARTRAAADALAGGDWRAAGALMYESHQSLRDDFEVSSPELDTLVDLACEIGEAGGVFGARMTGGGFGGCTVTLAATDRVTAIGDSWPANTTVATIARCLVRLPPRPRRPRHRDVAARAASARIQGQRFTRYGVIWLPSGPGLWLPAPTSHSVARVPLPIWPSTLRPQQCTVASAARITQACS